MCTCRYEANLVYETEFLSAMVVVKGFTETCLLNLDTEKT